MRSRRPSTNGASAPVVHVAGHPRGNRQHCLRCGAVVTEHMDRPGVRTGEPEPGPLWLNVGTFVTELEDRLEAGWRDGVPLCNEEAA